MSGPRVGVTGARKGAELAIAFERRGAWVLQGQTLGGDRPAGDAELAAALDRLAGLEPRWLAASTGTGMRLLGSAAERTGRQETLRATLAGCTAVARGAKAAGVLRNLGLDPAWGAPDELDSQVEDWLAARVRPGEVVAVQRHGAAGHPYTRLADAGIVLETLTPYVSAPPEDARPGIRLARAAADGELDVVTFTSAGAVQGLEALAGDSGLGARLRAALAGPVAVAVVGPVTREAARRTGYTVTIEPTPPRSGALVRAVMDWWHTR